jgi:hypothetical protein
MFVVAGCSLGSQTKKFTAPHLALTPAGTARAREVVFKRADFPSYYAPDGSSGTHGSQDCVNLSDLTVVGRASAPIFDLKEASEITPAAASYSWALRTPTQASNAFESADRHDFTACLERGYRALFTNAHDAADVSIHPLKLDLVAAEGEPGNARGYNVQIRIKSDDGSNETAAADVIAVRLGRALGLYVFATIGMRTAGVDYSEQSAVALAAGRSARSDLYRSETSGLDPVFTVSKGPYRVGAPVRFTARKAKQSGFNWSYGDGREDNAISRNHRTVTHRYRKPGRYTVDLAVGLGPSAESKAELTVLPAN